MRERLLNWLVCPVCRQALKPEIIRKKDGQIWEGLLHCEGRHIYPIIEGVPRMLCGDLLDNLIGLYPDLPSQILKLSFHRAMLHNNLNPNDKLRTMERFGYEWNQFEDYNCDNMEQFVQPLPSNYFMGKLGLDVGCGNGRHAKQVSRMGAEIIAVDISNAVDAAQKKCVHNDRIHVVQGDVYNLPFRHSLFEFIYSLGVIHHLPEPEKGYRSLVPFLRENGSLFIWVYANSLRKKALELLRFASMKLSNKNIQRMAFVCNLVDYGVFMNLYRFSNNLPLIGRIVENLWPPRIREYASHGFRVSYVDWFDRLSAPITNYYKQGQMQEWLSRSGLVNQRLLSEGDSWWWLYGEKAPG